MRETKVVSGDAVMNPIPDADLLQAYVDGELSVDEVAALEARLRTEPHLASALVSLAREEAILTEWAKAAKVVDRASGGVPAAAAERQPHTRRMKPPKARRRSRVAVWVF